MIGKLIKTIHRLNMHLKKESIQIDGQVTMDKYIVEC